MVLPDTLPPSHSAYCPMDHSSPLAPVEVQELCSSCQQQPAHPCYRDRCEDCWANSMDKCYGSTQVTLALMVHLNHSRYKVEASTVFGAYRHWQRRIVHKSL